MHRILVYGMTENSGGIEACLMNYFRRFDRTKVLFDFVTEYHTVAYEEEITRLGGKIYRIPARRENLIKHMLSLRKIVSENGYDTVYFNLLSASAVFSELALFGKQNVKIITHSHNDSVGNRKVHMALRPLLNRMTDTRFACSDAAAEFMFGKRYAKKTTVVNNAIEAGAYQFDASVRDAVRKEFGLTDKLVIGHVGRLCYQKNTLFLIDIFHEIRKRKENAVLLLVGDGEDRDAVCQKIRALELADSVVMTGVRSDVARLLQAMDIFLLPSRFEGLSIALVEAQASGLMCYTSSAVSRQTKITELLRFVEQNATAEEWAQAALSHTDYERKNTRAEIRSAGYDIETQALHLQNLLQG